MRRARRASRAEERIDRLDARARPVASDARVRSRSDDARLEGSRTGRLTRSRDRGRSRTASNAAKGRVLSRMEEYVDVERAEDGEVSSALEVRGDSIERMRRARSRLCRVMYLARGFRD